MKLVANFQSIITKAPLPVPLDMDDRQREYVAAFAYTFLFGLFSYLEDYPQAIDAFRVSEDAELERKIRLEIDNEPAMKWLRDVFLKGVHPREILGATGETRKQNFSRLIANANLFAGLLARYASDDTEVLDKIFIERPKPETLRLIGAHGGVFADLCVEYWNKEPIGIENIV